MVLFVVEYFILLYCVLVCNSYCVFCRFGEGAGAAKCSCFVCSCAVFACLFCWFICAPATTNKSMKQATKNTLAAMQKRSGSSEVFWLRRFLSAHQHEKINEASRHKTQLLYCGDGMKRQRDKRRHRGRGRVRGGRRRRIEELHHRSGR